MRILIFHGYLLEGTGSNVYNARLAEALIGLGHEVHLLCQDRHPERQAFVDATGDWDEGMLRVRCLDGEREPYTRARHAGVGVSEGGSCTVYRPNIGGLLPVYVADRYEGIETRTFARCSAAEIDRYVDANVAAVRDVVARARPDVALANHLVMGPAILARALGETPYAVKVHGSALEYTVKPEPERFLPFAREGLAGASTVLVGSAHTARSLWEALQDPELPRRTRLGPPGVDVHRFKPLPEDELEGALAAAARVLAEDLRSSAPTAAADRPAGDSAADRPAGDSAADRPAGDSAADRPGDLPMHKQSAFTRDDLAAAAVFEQLAELADTGPVRPVAFVGKLIVSKGVDLLLAAWPLVLDRVPSAALLVIGFGAYRETLEQLAAALAAGDLQEVIAIARAGRALEQTDTGDLDTGDLVTPLRHLLAFLDALDGDARERYCRAAQALPERVVFTGRLDHRELAELLPACEALVVPSTFPEAFGMVAAEGAACGALPVSAAHSGLAEVSDALASSIPPAAAAWLSFAVDDRVVSVLADCLTGWLQAAPELRAQTRTGLVATVRERWSWEGVARTVIAAAQGQLGKLPPADDFARAVG